MAGDHWDCVTERRRDPVYWDWIGFNDLRERYAGAYGRRALQRYWETRCVEERRWDEDWTAVSWREFREKHGEASPIEELRRRWRHLLWVDDEELLSPPQRDLEVAEEEDEEEEEEEEEDNGADGNDDESSTACKSAQPSGMSLLASALPASPAARRGLGPPPSSAPPSPPLPAVASRLGPPPSSAPPPPPLPAVAADHSGIARSVEAQTQALAAVSPPLDVVAAAAPAALKGRRKGIVAAGSRPGTVTTAKEPQSSNAATTADVERRPRSRVEEISCRSSGSGGRDRAVEDGTAAFARASQQHDVRRSEAFRKSKVAAKEKLTIAGKPPKPPVLTQLRGWVKGVAAAFVNFITGITDTSRELLSGCRKNPKTTFGIIVLVEMLMLMWWLHTVQVEYKHDPYSYGSYPGWGYAQGSYDPDAYYEYLTALQAMHGPLDEYSEEYRKAIEELWSHDGWDSKQHTGVATREALSKDSSDFCHAPSELELLRKAFTGQSKRRNRRPVCKLKAAAPPP